MTEPAPHDLLPPVTDRHPSEFALAALLEAEPDPRATAALQGHLDTCDACRRRLERLTAARTGFLAAQPFDTFEAGLRRRRAQPPERTAPRRPLRRWGFALAAAGALALAVVSAHLLLAEPASGPSAVTAKGATVRWVVLRGGKQHGAPPGFEFAAGDRIGVEVVSSRAVWAVALAVDPRGEVTVLPAPSAAPIPIPAARPTPLPFSVQLEPPLEPTRLFVVLTPHPPSLDALVVATRAEATAAPATAGRALAAAAPGAISDSRLITLR